VGLVLVGRGLAALERAYATGGPLGPYALQAGVATCHARERVPEDTDWEQIAALYGGLAQLMPSPVVELNRAVAIGMGRPAGGDRHRQRPASRTRPRPLSPAAQRARRPAGEARPPRRGPSRVRAGRTAHRELAARHPARACSRVPRQLPALITSSTRTGHDGRHVARDQRWHTNDRTEVGPYWRSASRAALLDPPGPRRHRRTPRLAYGTRTSFPLRGRLLEQLFFTLRQSRLGDLDLQLVHQRRLARRGQRPGTTRGRHRVRRDVDRVAQVLPGQAPDSS
jgi:hypothetical protein